MSPGGRRSRTIDLDPRKFTDEELRRGLAELPDDSAFFRIVKEGWQRELDRRAAEVKK